MFVKTNLKKSGMEFNAWLCAVAILAIALFVYLVVNRKIVDVKGKRVLITGSASGIGRMLAGDMAKKVPHGIAILIRRERSSSCGTSTDLCWRTRRMRSRVPIRSYGIASFMISDCAVYTYVVDLSNRESIK